MIMMPKTKKKMYECDDGVYVYDNDGEVIGECEGCGWFSYRTGETYLLGEDEDIKEIERAGDIATDFDLFAIDDSGLLW